MLRVSERLRSALGSRLSAEKRPEPARTRRPGGSRREPRVQSRRLCLALVVAGALLLAAPPLGAQDPLSSLSEPVTGPLYVRDAGPGTAGRHLRRILSRPHTVIDARGRRMPDPLVLPKDSLFAQTVVVVNGDVAVEARVNGDVVTLGGGLFLRPGAEIDGDAVAYSQDVYNSMLAIVRGRRVGYPVVGWSYERTGRGTALDYRALDVYERPFLELTGIYGFDPFRGGYDRSNGVSLHWGPLVNVADGRVEVEPAVVYRSDLGAIDSRLDVAARIDRRTRFLLNAERGTFTNERWIRGDIGNSFASLFAGSDARNYWRAWTADARIARVWEGVTGQVEPWLGALYEDAWSTGPELDPEHVVWSLLNRRDEKEGMARPNPPVRKGTIASARAGADGEWTFPQQLTLRLGGFVEVPFDSPGDDRWVQATIDGRVSFPALRTHTIVLETHALLTVGDSTPPQRYTYMGGSGTLPTVDLLTLGGDQAFFADARYIIPFERVRIQFVGSPTLVLRYAVGSAGVSRLPDFVQNIGARVELGFLKVEYMYDPERRDGDLSAGVRFGR